jgi:hypothetical protein
MSSNAKVAFLRAEIAEAESEAALKVATPRYPAYFASRHMFVLLGV